MNKLMNERTNEYSTAADSPSATTATSADKTVPRHRVKAKKKRGTRRSKSPAGDRCVALKTDNQIQQRK